MQHESYEAAAVAQGNEVLDAAERTARELGVGNTVKHLLVANKGAREMAQDLVDYADENGAGLLVLGTHGRTGLMHLLMGSFAETVMRQSHLPLLIIRSKAEEA
ncbi:putative universal stress protein [Neisseria gonorrhoeae]|uniref:Putative universal stress protein n=1 Tax=Neisseria gonorrhoeae TaxID=485 RepID=A0A378VVJ3_NEIGO|nr:putative universal stress protein [Neisseria gonorrhoeae]